MISKYGVLHFFRGNDDIKRKEKDLVCVWGGGCNEVCQLKCHKNPAEFPGEATEAGFWDLETGRSSGTGSFHKEGQICLTLPGDGTHTQRFLYVMEFKTFSRPWFGFKEVAGKNM